MVLNRQLECGFSKGSPSLINTFVLSPWWAASWNACNCHWLEKMFICFFKRQNWKIAFYQHFRTLNASPPPRMKLSGNQQLECLQGHIFSRQKRIYIPDPPSHHKKGSLPHNFHSFSNFLWVFGGSGYMNVHVWEYHLIFCALCRSGYFYSLSPFDNLDKSEFRVQKFRFWTHTWGR